jgi:hypothetical protein
VKITLMAALHGVMKMMTEVSRRKPSVLIVLYEANMVTLTLMACEESIRIAVEYLAIKKRKTERNRVPTVSKTIKTTDMYCQMVIPLIWNLLSKTKQENQLLNTETDIFEHAT